MGIAQPVLTTAQQYETQFKVAQSSSFSDIQIRKCGPTKDFSSGLYYDVELEI